MTRFEPTESAGAYVWSHMQTRPSLLIEKLESWKLRLICVRMFLFSFPRMRLLLATNGMQQTHPRKTEWGEKFKHCPIGRRNGTPYWAWILIEIVASSRFPHLLLFLGMWHALCQCPPIMWGANDGICAWCDTSSAMRGGQFVFVSSRRRGLSRSCEGHMHLLSFFSPLSIVFYCFNVMPS